MKSNRVADTLIVATLIGLGGFAIYLMVKGYGA